MVLPMLRGCCWDGACGNQLLSSEIHSQVQPLEPMGAEQGEITRIREHHRRRGAPSAGVNQRKPYRPIEHAPVCGLETVDANGNHAKLREHVHGNPVVFAASVHHDIVQLAPPVGGVERGDRERRSENPHAGHDTVPKSIRFSHFNAAWINAIAHLRELPEPSEPVTRRQTNSFWSDEPRKLTAETIEIRKMVYTHRKRVLETPDDE